MTKAEPFGSAFCIPLPASRFQLYYYFFFAGAAAPALGRFAP